MKLKWLAAAGLMLCGMGVANAHTDLSIGIGIPVGPAYYAPPPPVYRERVYYDNYYAPPPPPVYYAPPPRVYYAPPPRVEYRESYSYYGPERRYYDGRYYH